MPASQVSTLLGWLSIEGCQLPSSIEIHENKEIVVGRDSRRCNFVLEDLSISNLHFRVYSIIWVSPGEPRKEFIYVEDLSMNGTFWQYSGGGKVLIGKGNSVLLSEGDCIRPCDGTVFVLHTVIPVTEQPNTVEISNEALQMEIESFSNLYTITDRVLGTGGFGEVRVAMDRFKQQQRACKIVALKGLSPQGQIDSFAKQLWREVDLLRMISHPNIVQVERAFYTDQSIYIIEDLITGGDLMSYIERRAYDPLHEAEASLIVYQILKALEHLHGLGIVHRDLKPENILLSKPTADARIILADFGHSIQMNLNHKTQLRRMETLCGTIDYVAPEVHGRNPMVKQKGYTMATDMWSVAALTAVLLQGSSFFASYNDSEFRHDSVKAILDAASHCNLDKLEFDPCWQLVDPLVKDFLRQLFVLDETKRMKVGPALTHPWFTQEARKDHIKDHYQRIVSRWKPKGPRLDYKEDLSIFMNNQVHTKAHRSVLNISCPNSKVLDHTSPYFESLGSKYSFNDAVGPAKVNLPHLIDSRSPHCTASYGRKRIPYEVINFPTTSKGTAEAELSGSIETQRFTQSCASHASLPQSINDTKYEYTEINLHLQVGQELRGFWSAKSFCCAVNKKRKLKD